MQHRDENEYPSPLVQKISIKTRIPATFETLTAFKDGVKRYIFEMRITYKKEVKNISPRDMINRR